jgi:hypothetical protein
LTLSLFSKAGEPKEEKFFNVDFFSFSMNCSANINMNIILSENQSIKTNNNLKKNWTE